MLKYPKPPKRKKKSKHISNKRITEYMPCEVCHMRGVNPPNRAVETHEIYHKGTSGVRNMCVHNKWQVKVCMDCDHVIHRTDGKLDNQLKKEWQQSIMEENDWNEDEWRLATDLMNYL